jgi:hypothetical protein
MFGFRSQSGDLAYNKAIRLLSGFVFLCARTGACPCLMFLLLLLLLLYCAGANMDCPRQRGRTRNGKTVGISVGALFASPGTSTECLR